MAMNEVDELREQEYQKRLQANQLRWKVYQQSDPAASKATLDELLEAEKELRDVEKKRARAQTNDPSNSGLFFDTQKDPVLLGRDTTGIEAKVHVRMAQVPTSICHLLDSERNPLVTCWVRNSKDKDTCRLRVTSFIEGYSAQAVDTFELKAKKEHTFSQLPTLFTDRVRHLNELTRATLNIVLEDIDKKVVELHKTKPIWLLARTSAPLAVMDPKSGTWKDMTQYFGAFVTPNARSLMSFLRVVTNYHPEKRLVGYQVVSPLHVDV